jgi:hypothetical protein
VVGALVQFAVGGFENAGDTGHMAQVQRHLWV